MSKRPEMAIVPKPHMSWVHVRRWTAQRRLSPTIMTANDISPAEAQAALMSIAVQVGGGGYVLATVKDYDPHKDVFVVTLAGRGREYEAEIEGEAVATVVQLAREMSNLQAKIAQDPRRNGAA